MPETGDNDSDQHATDVEQLLERIRNLEARPRQELVDRLMEGVFHAPAKRVAVSKAVESASEDVEPALVTEAVKSAGSLEGKKAAASEAVKSAKDGEEQEVIAEAVRSAETLEGRRIAAAEAVRSIPELTEKANILGALQKEAKGVRKMLGHMIIWSIIVIAVVGVLAIGMGLLGRSSTAQPLIIIGTAVASTLAGYILGASYMMGDSLRTLAREGTREQRDE